MPSIALRPLLAAVALAGPAFSAIALDPAFIAITPSQGQALGVATQRVVSGSSAAAPVSRTARKRVMDRGEVIGWPLNKFCFRSRT